MATKSEFLVVTALVFIALLACADYSSKPSPVEAVEPESVSDRKARFDWFDYAGNDPVYAAINAPGTFRNPILAGFYPDPGATRVGDDFYIVNSTFAYFPGIPVFHSTDLVNWTQIGNVIDRPGMLDFDGLGMSRGVFAPTIDHRNGTYYVANTCVDCGGNFIVTTKHPAGPWSDPVWLPDVGGIDPSLFFDDDGKVYIMNNDAPPAAPRYDGHRAIWIREIDPETFESISEPVVLVDGGVRPEEKPIWIEGPNIYKVEQNYYLSAAEGGTAEGHSQVVLKSDSVLGPYSPYGGNPILTQRHLPSDRPDPVTSVGHAKLLKAPNGEWWATFLGVRPYEGDFYNTGRETFLLPVRWRDGWPVILDGEESVPLSLASPDLPAGDAPPNPMNGNFEFRDDFSDAELALYWLFIRVPDARWYDLQSEPGTLIIEPRPISLGGLAQPSYVGRRQQHLNATASTSVRFSPQVEGDTAGLAAFQNDFFYYSLGISLSDDTPQVELRRRAGTDEPEDGIRIAAAPLAVSPGAPVYLRIEAKGAKYDFSWATEQGHWKTIGTNLDGKILSTRTAGGFVGVTLGMFARSGTTE